MILGAYGRTYRTFDAMLKDWHLGKDFRVKDADGGACSYCSVRDTDLLMGLTDTLYFVHNTGIDILNIGGCNEQP